MNVVVIMVVVTLVVMIMFSVIVRLMLAHRSVSLIVRAPSLITFHCSCVPRPSVFPLVTHHFSLVTILSPFAPFPSSLFFS